MKAKKLNLGCGKDYKDPNKGWVNLDYNKKYAPLREGEWGARKLCNFL